MSMPAVVDLLFVPADRPDRFAKALAAASAICIDLEDAVAPARKAEARALLGSALADGALSLDRVVVRIQAEGTPGHAEDMALVAGAPGLKAVMLPKAETPEAAARVSARLNGVGVIALLETARGLRHAHEIAAAPGVVGLALGALDLAADLGAVFNSHDLDHFRRLLRLAAAEARIDCWNSPWPAIGDEAGLAEDARRAAALGFTGMLCIHPAQVASIRAAFVPSPEAVSRARRILEAAQAAGGAALQLDDVMIDAPVIARARQTLERAASFPLIEAPDTP